MNISFDIDNALNNEQVQTLAKLLLFIRKNLDKGYVLMNVIMITDRDRDEWEYNHSMKVLLDGFGLSMSNVYFTDGRPKVDLVRELDIDIHVDADPGAVSIINSEFPGKGWLINYTEKIKVKKKK